MGHARSRRGSVEVSIRELALRQRREHDAADLLFAEHIQQQVFDPAVEHRVLGLVDEQRRTQSPQNVHRTLGLGRTVVGDAGVESLALANRGVERPHGLLDGSGRVGPMRVEDVDVVETEPAEALIQACQHVLARTPIAVGSGPHGVAGLGRDDQLVPICSQVQVDDPSEVLLGRTGRWAVVVRQVEVRDAEVESPANDRPLPIQRGLGAEVVPEAERESRQRETAVAGAPVLHCLVTPRLRGIRPVQGFDHFRQLRNLSFASCRCVLCR